MDIYRLPGIIRLDPETGVKQYLNTPSGYIASSPENELFIYEDPNGVVWTIPYKGIFSYYDEKSRELKVYFTPGRNHIPYSPILKQLMLTNKIFVDQIPALIYKNVLSA